MARSLPRLTLRFEVWPEGDRRAWEKGCTAADADSPDFDEDEDDDDPYGATLRPPSLKKVQHGYARWLHFLESRGWLDHSAPAFDRVTKRRLRAYFRELRHVGNADFTIIGRFQELEMALKILSPGSDTSWVRRPFGPTVYRQLRKTKRHLLVPDSGVLYQWGLAMMDDADPAKVPDHWRTTYRDGLLIAMFAARGRRRRSMHLLGVGKELFWNGERYRIELTPDQVKTGRSDKFNLPERLTPYVRHYLDVVRPALLKEHWYDALWISRRGTPLTIDGMETRIFRLTLKRFGQWFGPHRFRHAIATSLAVRVSGQPGLPSAALSISPGVSGKHYVRAEQIEASRININLVEDRKRKYSLSLRRQRIASCI